MRTPTFALLVCCALLVVMGAPSAHANDEAVYAKLEAAKAPTVVSVKFVLTVKIMRNGAAVMAPQEQSGSSTGVIVDPSGLIMLPGSAFGVGRLGIPRQMRQGLEIQATPSNIRVVFPGDTKEYDAILGAKDSKLGLAFVLVRELGDKKLTAIDTAQRATPAIGSALYGVTRLDQGFDHAAVISRVDVAGKVSKPRDMWVVRGAEQNVGEPLYNAAGAMCGIVVVQEGVGEDSEQLPFLLPLDVAEGTMASSLKQSKEELDRVLEEEEEAAARAEDEKSGEKKDGDGEDSDGKDSEGKDAEEKDADKKDGGDGK
ncbi:MAG: hypothetical protein O2894_05450 [Planctomycetota bacterium]|nr:hypothetical protein [Planctomycetota bacterium]